MISNWILAARPKTLFAGLSPVAIGTALAISDGGFNWFGMVSALLCAMSVQIGTNFCNDYCDFFQGADTDDRKGPTRAVQAGLISPRAMLVATVIMFSITGLSAYGMYTRAGWLFLLLGAFSILFGVMYTAGRFSLAYLGIADPFVLFFFGPVAVSGTHYAQTLQFDWSTLIAGMGPGLLATGLLVVNNLRDIDEDRVANKRTLAVRFGATFSRVQYAFCVIVASFVPVMFVVFKDAASWGPSLASLVIIPATFIIAKIWTSDGIALRPYLGMTAGLLLMFTLLFCLGLAIG